MASVPNATKDRMPFHKASLSPTSRTEENVLLTLLYDRFANHFANQVTC